MSNTLSPFFIKMRWRFEFYQKNLYIILAGLFLWRTFLPLVNPVSYILEVLNGKPVQATTIPQIGLNIPPTWAVYTQPFGIVSPGEPHQLSFFMIFILGIYMIRKPYYQEAQNWFTLIKKLIQSISAILFATLMTEGTWDIVYTQVYGYQAPDLVSGVIGGLALTGEVTTLFIITQSYKLFNLKKIAVIILFLYILYGEWYFSFGFITSGAPDFSSSLTIAIIEQLHWAIGIFGCMWALKSFNLDNIINTVNIKIHSFLEFYDIEFG